jgi:hypothetical protein
VFDSSQGSSVNGWWTIGAGGNQWQLESGANGNTHNFVSIGNAEGSGFEHFVVTYDATAQTWKMYHDGVQNGADIDTTAYHIGDTGNRIEIGSWMGSNWGNWEGNIDSLTIWNKVIDQDTIDALYDSGSGSETIMEDAFATTYPATPAWQSEFDNAVANGRNCDVVELGIQPSAQTEYNALYTGIKDGSDVLIENNDFCAKNNEETISIATTYNERMAEDYYAIGIRHDGLGVKLTDESTCSGCGAGVDPNWTTDDETNSFHDVANERLQYRADTASGTGGDEVYYDLGTTLSDTDWVMRFTWTWDNPSDDTKWFFGISDQAGKNGGVDGIRGDGTADSAGTLWYCGGGGCSGTYTIP